MSAGLQDVAKRAPRTVNNALAPFYAGTRIAETVGLDIDDVALSARRGSLRIHGKGDQTRQVPTHPPLRAAFTGWLSEHTDWPGAEEPALFLNQQGSRLSTAGAHTIITTIAAAAGLDEKTTVYVLRHTFATSLVRGGTDLVTVAELLGHTRRRSL
ncbi:tyrosine-type recombinase/integrase [Frankia sp. Mgl5]|uniref:tyrosine-type recombinase/integrase n=1 Tax=Frankia sp. Mgl5 TaxID=2933793 RepID=UPI00200BAC5E|nr:tyrosine-type recombinase/integrase [Frankia sp. Mgl5]MCK9927767.1 tyrosine-type recombinase/integrase [Frankia sp. Mgl5]